MSEIFTCYTLEEGLAFTMPHKSGSLDLNISPFPQLYVSDQTSALSVQHNEAWLHP